MLPARYRASETGSAAIRATGFVLYSAGDPSSSGGLEDEATRSSAAHLPDRCRGRLITAQAMNSAELRDQCLSLTGAEETFPFGPKTSVLKVGGKMFALFQLGADSFRVSPSASRGSPRRCVRRTRR